MLILILWLLAAARADPDAPRELVFVHGFARSGTTLVGKEIRDAVGAGDIERRWQSRSARK